MPKQKATRRLFGANGKVRAARAGLPTAVIAFDAGRFWFLPVTPAASVPVVRIEARG